MFSKILRNIPASAISPFSDEEAEANPFYRDFLTFLEYIKIHSPKLTGTGNLNLKSLAEINERLIRKKAWEEKLGEHIYRIRSEYEMPYIKILDVLAPIVGLCRRKRKKMMLVKSAEKKFSSLPHGVRFNILWKVYLLDLNWAYIAYLENEAEIAEVLQLHQNMIWLMLRDFDIETTGGWISIEHTLEMIRKEYNIGWKTYYGDNPDSARWGIETVIFRNILEVFDFVEIRKTPKKFRLTQSGRKAINAQVPFDWGLGFTGSS